MVISIELEGEPRGKGRPRSRVAWTRDDKPFVAVYTDVETRRYEASLAWAAKVVMRGKPPLKGPLEIAVEAHFSVPASWSQKKRDAALAGVIRPTGKPDFDNLLKGIDALKGIVMFDDSQVVEARIKKLYSERPHFRIDIEEVEPWTVESLTDSQETISA